MKKFLAPALLVAWLAIAGYAASAYAQVAGPAAAGEEALSKLVQEGILGTLSVILMLVVWYLYRRIEKLQDQIVAQLLDFTGKLSGLMAETNTTLKAQNALLEKVLERTAKLYYTKSES